MQSWKTLFGFVKKYINIGGICQAHTWKNETFGLEIQLSGWLVLGFIIEKLQINATSPQIIYLLI